ncbi:MAG: hypothetical protein NTZ52_02545 [Chlamydiae bacterium]|nr:hypothetical protein [Chlamydiota bacterium]
MQERTPFLESPPSYSYDRRSNLQPTKRKYYDYLNQIHLRYTRTAHLTSK